MLPRPFTGAVMREEDLYVARCLEVDVASQGRTVEESLANLREALELYYEDELPPWRDHPTVIAYLQIPTQPPTAPRLESRGEVQRLLDRACDSYLPEVRQFLENLLAHEDPLLRALHECPYDDEPWTEADEQAFQESQADVEAGRLIPHEEAMRLLGVDDEALP